MNTFSQLLGRLVCAAMGHKRGKRLGVSCISLMATFECPRCLTTWTRKARKGTA